MPGCITSGCQNDGAEWNFCFALLAQHVYASPNNRFKADLGATEEIICTLATDELVKIIYILDLFASTEDAYEPEAKDRRPAQEILLEWLEHSAISSSTVFWKTALSHITAIFRP